MALGDSKA
jgi:hypothetical protein